MPKSPKPSGSPASELSRSGEDSDAGGGGFRTPLFAGQDGGSPIWLTQPDRMRLQSHFASRAVLQANTAGSPAAPQGTGGSHQGPQELLTPPAEAPPEPVPTAEGANNIETPPAACGAIAHPGSVWTPERMEVLLRQVSILSPPMFGRGLTRPSWVAVAESLASDDSFDGWRSVSGGDCHEQYQTMMAVFRKSARSISSDTGYSEYMVATLACLAQSEADASNG